MAPRPFGGLVCRGLMTACGGGDKTDTTQHQPLRSRRPQPHPYPYPAAARATSGRADARAAAATTSSPPPPAPPPPPPPGPVGGDTIRQKALGLLAGSYALTCTTPGNVVSSRTLDIAFDGFVRLSQASAVDFNALSSVFSLTRSITRDGVYNLASTRHHFRRPISHQDVWRPLMRRWARTNTSSIALISTTQPRV